MALASFASSSSASGPSRPCMLVWGSGSAGGQQMVSDFGLWVIGNRRLTITQPNPAGQAFIASLCEKHAWATGEPARSHLFFQDALQFRDAGNPAGDHNLAVQHHRWSAHDAKFENLGNVRDMGNVGREIELRTGVDDISLGRLAVGAAGPRDLNRKSTRLNSSH